MEHYFPTTGGKWTWYGVTCSSRRHSVVGGDNPGGLIKYTRMPSGLKLPSRDSSDDWTVCAVLDFVVRICGRSGPTAADQRQHASADSYVSGKENMLYLTGTDLTI